MAVASWELHAHVSIMDLQSECSLQREGEKEGERGGGGEDTNGGCATVTRGVVDERYPYVSSSIYHKKKKKKRKSFGLRYWMQM